MAARLCPGGPPWRARRASRRLARDAEGTLLDEVLVTWMPGPASATGEDVVELGCHGNPVIVERLLDACVAAGARPARPGEFTRRALEQGRIDLVQAEATAALIGARSPLALATVRSAAAGLGLALDALYQALLSQAAEVEARLDHPGEDLGEAEDAAVVGALEALAARAEALSGTWRAGRIRIEGARVALVGPVNAGKSSLFNALLGERRALVSERPGTTRDVVERGLLVEGLELTLLDTAGERESEDPLERAGVDLGRALSEEVDLLVVVVPGHRPPDPAEQALLERTRDRDRLVVTTHADLPAWPGRTVEHAVSAVTGQGVDALRTALRRRLGSQGALAGDRATVFSQRQHELLRAVAAHARLAGEALDGPAGPAIAAEELTRALQRLGELSGRDVREEVLDALFARFCIGK